MISWELTKLKVMVVIDIWFNHFIVADKVINV